MKKFLSIILFAFLLSSSGYSKTEINDIKKSIKEDQDEIPLILKVHLDLP